MAIGSSNYASPVTVNGFSCRNCTDVSYATKRIDPAHPQSGPDGVSKASDPSQPPAVKAKAEHARTALAGHDRAAQGYSAHGKAAGGTSPGQLVDTQA